MSLRLGILFLIGLAAPIAVHAHEDPDGCFELGVNIDVGLFRANGTTFVVGSVTDCEPVLYRLVLSKPNSTSLCAFSGGTLTLTTPDGVLHTTSASVPCIGGTAGDCDPVLTSLDSGFIPYTVSADDVRNGTIVANAVYSGGVVHDSGPDTPGVFLSVPKSIAVVPCDATTTVTTSSSTTTTTTIPKSACASLKFEAATELASAIGECDAKALKFGVSVRPECLEAAGASFAKSWAMAERRGDCLTVNDQAAVETVVGSCTGALQSVLLP
jgi:hypothetical protein